MRLFLLLFALAPVAYANGNYTDIDPAHGGDYSCVCSDPRCSGQQGAETKITILPHNGTIAIAYQDQIQGGRPARAESRTTHAVEYTLASGGRVAFTADGAIRFGLGKLWTCTKE